MRDHEGRILKHRRISWPGVWSSKEAEARALLESLSWVEKEGFQQAIIESDAQLVVQAVRGICSDITEFGEIVRGCRSIMDRNPGFVVGFVKRERNGVAHVIARHSSSCAKPVEGTASLDFIDNVLLELCSAIHE
ncbi:hypothetical protein LINPERHAP2_LOCUS35257 [Linum perenne]